MPGPTRRDVRATYDRIGPHFSDTRAYAWPEVEEFLADRSGRVALDVGCGNGRHAELLADRCERVLAVDASAAMLAAARDRLAGTGAALAAADAVRLPVRRDAVDLAVFVATVHHLPGEDARRESLAELARVLAPGGRALVSTWSTAHDRFDAAAGFDTTVDWTLPDGTVVDRYYHIYAPGEFRDTLDATPLAVRDFEVSSGNCYAVVAPPPASE